MTTRRGHRIVGSLVAFSRALLDFALPDSCLHCGAPIRAGERCLCPVCAATVRLKPARAVPTIRTGGDEPGGDSIPDTPVVCATPYEGAVRSLIRALKFADRPDAVRPLGALLAELVVAQLPDAADAGVVLVPVPLHRTRRRERGYDQSRLLAECAAACDPRLAVANLLVRRRPTRPQTSLARQERLRNVTGVFAVRRSWSPRRSGDDPRSEAERALVVLDDVVTTGATVLAARAALAGAGLTVRLAAAAAGAPPTGEQDTETARS